MEQSEAAVLVDHLLSTCVFNVSDVFLDSEVGIITLKKKSYSSI